MIYELNSSKFVEDGNSGASTVLYLINPGTYLLTVVIVSVCITDGPAALLAVQPKCLRTDSFLQIGHPGGTNVNNTRTEAYKHSQNSSNSGKIKLGFRG